jgi:hypothetical protein
MNLTNPCSFRFSILPSRQAKYFGLMLHIGEVVLRDFARIKKQQASFVVRVLGAVGAELQPCRKDHGSFGIAQDNVSGLPVVGPVRQNPCP